MMSDLITLDGSIKYQMLQPSESAFVLDEVLLDEHDRIKLLPASAYQDLPPDDLRIFCARHARYGIPTSELIEWLKERIGDRYAIEVAAGNGDLGYHLGIQQTDSYVQQSSDMKLIYSMMGGQVTTSPKEDVIRLDAESAVQVLKPEVVVASWLTRKFIKGVDVDGKSEASIYGPIEEKILKGTCEYIHIGNMGVHSQKTLLSLPHETYFFPWLVSRAANPSLNVIHVWKNPYYPEGRRQKRSK